MTNRFYRRGYRFEWYVKRKLEEKGYKTARSAGSHTEFDIYAILPFDDWFSKIELGLRLLGLDKHICDEIRKLLKNNPQVMGIQCKKSGKLSKSEKIKMLESYGYYNIKPILATKKGRRLVFENVVTEREVEL